MPKKPTPKPLRSSKDKALAFAKKDNRKVLWKDKDGNWHAATNRANTPHYAIETEDV